MMPEAGELPTDHRIARKSLQAETTDRLRDEIVEGVWKPGERLQERLLCDRFGISRSPLREAYQVLASEGLLELLPNRGAVVTRPSPAFILQNYVLVRALETLAIELACDNASEAEIRQIVDLNAQMKTATKDTSHYLHLNNEVHRAIVRASHNDPLIDAHLLVSRQIIRVQNLNGPMEHTIDESSTEHDAFMDALQRRDRRAAGTKLRQHLKTAEENVKRRLADLS